MRQYAQAMLEARAAQLQGETAVSKLVEELEKRSKQMGRIFNGEDERFTAPLWNSPGRLGRYLQRRFDWDCTPEESVQLLFLRLFQLLTELVERNEAGEYDHELTAQLLEWLIGWARNALLGVDETPQIQEVKPPKHPLVKRSPGGHLLVFTPAGTEPFETALKAGVPEADRRWDPELLCWQVEPEHHWELALLVHQFFDALDPANQGPPWPVGLPCGADDGPELAPEMLETHLDWFSALAPRRELKRENGEFYWHWMGVLWANCYRLEREAPEWLGAILASGPASEEVAPSPPPHPLLTAPRDAPLRLLVPYEPPEFRERLDAFVAEPHRVWNAEQGWWELPPRYIWVASYLLHSTFPAAGFGEGVLPYGAYDDPEFTREDWEMFLRDLADPGERWHLHVGASEGNGDPTFFWRHLFYLRHNAERHRLLVPPWLINILQVAPQSDAAQWSEGRQ